MPPSVAKAGVRGDRAGALPRRIGSGETPHPARRNAPRRPRPACAGRGGLLASGFWLLAS